MKYVLVEDGKEKMKLKLIVKGDQVGCNDDCLCGSGKKFKNCYGK